MKCGICTTHFIQSTRKRKERAAGGLGEQTWAVLPPFSSLPVHTAEIGQNHIPTHPSSSVSMYSLGNSRSTSSAVISCMRAHAMSFVRARDERTPRSEYAISLKSPLDHPYALERSSMSSKKLFHDSKGRERQSAVANPGEISPEDKSDEKKKV